MGVHEKNGPIGTEFFKYLRIYIVKELNVGFHTTVFSARGERARELFPQPWTMKENDR